jgi:hypothetical protein
MANGPLHTGEVVGSIPTAPTIDFPITNGFLHSCERNNSQRAAERRKNMTHVTGENPGNLFCKRSTIFAGKLFEITIQKSHS